MLRYNRYRLLFIPLSIKKHSTIMKLHLPKALLSAIAVIWALSPVYAETIKLSTGTAITEINRDITVGQDEYIGYVSSKGLYTDFDSTQTTNSLLLGKTEQKKIGIPLLAQGKYKEITTLYNLTLESNAIVAVGGKNGNMGEGKEEYLGTLIAGVVTVQDTAQLLASNAKLHTLNVNGGTVALHGGNTTNSDFSQGNNYLGNSKTPYGIEGTFFGSTSTSYINAPKQTQITHALNVSNGDLIMGSAASSANTPSYVHYVNAFGEKNVSLEIGDYTLGFSGQAAIITQDGGNMEVYGDSIAMGGLKIEQKGSENATMYFRDRLAFDSAGTNSIIQSNDNASLIIGRLIAESGNQTINIDQSGKGYIQLAYGTEFKSSAEGTINITQNGGGSIDIGGGHQGHTAVLGKTFANNEYTTYNLTQSESGGTITLKSGAAITADSVSQTTNSAILNVEKNAKLTATTMNTKGTVKNYGTIDTKDLTVSGKYLINYGDIAVSETLKLEGGQLQTNAAGATTHSSITAANVVMGEGTYFHHDNATIQIDKLTATTSEIRVRQDESSLVIGKAGADTVHEVSNTKIMTSGTNRQQSDALTLYVYGTLKGDNNTINGSAIIDAIEGNGFTFKDQGFKNSQLKVGSITGGYIDVLNQKGGVEIGTIVSNDEASVSAIKAYQIGDVVVDSIDDKGKMELYAATGNVTVKGAATAATLNIAAGAEVSIGGALNVGTADIESYNGGITLNGGVADTLTLKAATGKYSYLYGGTQVGDLNVDGGHFQVKSSTGTLNAENIQLDNAGAYALFDGSTTAENIISNGANVYSRVNTLTVNDTLQLNGGTLTVNNNGALNAGNLELNDVSSVYVSNGSLQVDKFTDTTGTTVVASGADSKLVLGQDGGSQIHEANGTLFQLYNDVTLQVNGTLKGDSIRVNGAASIDQVEGNAFALSNYTEQNVSIGMIKGDNANIGNTNGNVEIGKLETNSNDSRSYISARETGDVSIGSIQDSGSVSVTAYGGNISVTGDVSSADLYITASKDVSIGGTLNAEKALLSAGGTMDLNGGTVGELHLTANSTDAVITLNTNEDLNVLGSLNLGNGYGLELDFELNSLDDNGAIIMGDGADLIFAKELTEASVSLSLSDVAKQIMLDGSSLDLDTETVFTFTLISNLGEQDVEELTQAINGKLVLNSDELVLTIPNAVDFEHSLLLVQNGELRVEGNSLVVDVVTQTVPEPTTATLSLLALAALAARRRRR